jgi:hypothetical protein
MTLQGYVVLLAVAYALLGAVLLFLISYSRLSRISKISVIIIVSGFYFLVFFSLQGVQGWPAPVRVPARFQLLWTRVIEPNAAKGEPGAVYLWLEETDEANLPSGTPRAYALPYSRAFADKAEEAQAEIRQGRPQGGRTATMGSGLGLPPQASAGAAELNVAPGGDPSGGGLLDPEFLGGQSKTVELVPMPAPALPSKDEP